ncbi:ATPase [Amycolatopsis sp. NPDC059090]|uniref:RapZ C-terminal domain-containing protein n=1 Tax=Amycolatopsis sp. NPDC059090 TaxID=3346723 RepID=UPI00366A7694
MTGLEMSPFGERWQPTEPVGEFGLWVKPAESVSVTQVVITSFGYLHAGPRARAYETPMLTLDVRELFRDPHLRPELRELTGRDDAIRANVLDQPGAIEFVRAQAAAVAALVPGLTRVGPQARVAEVAVGCAGGRHRSVVIAEALALVLQAQGIGSDVQHRDIRRPVVLRPR